MTLTYVECIAVPDGIHGEPGQERLRLSVILRPEPLPKETPGTAPPMGTGSEQSAQGASELPPEPIDLANWPKEVAGLTFEVRIGSTVMDLDLLERQPSPMFDVPGAVPPLSQAVSDAAEKWWRETLWNRPEVLEAYADIFREPVAPASPPAPIEFYSYSHLVSLTESIVASDLAISLIALNNARSTTPQSAGLAAEAAARLQNPDSPAIRLADAVTIASSESFAGLAAGAAIADVLGTDPDRGPATIKALENVFQRTSDAIDSMIGGAAPRGELSPFAPPTPAVAMEAFERESLLTNRFGSTLIGPPAAQSANRTGPAQPYAVSERSLPLAAYQHASDSRRTPELPPSVWTKKLDEPTAEDRARLQASGLQAHPTLRKFVRLLVDFEIPLADIPAAIRSNGGGVISVAVSGRGASSVTPSTAFLLVEPDGEEIPLFEPAPAAGPKSDASSLVPTLPLDRGVVCLRAKRLGSTNKVRRFCLVVTDGKAAINALQTGVEARIEGMRKGLPVQASLANEPGLRTGGLTLLDTQAFVPAHIAEREPPASLRDDRPMTAEQLVDGYYAYIVDDLGNLHPLSARTLRYGELEKIPGVAGRAGGLYGDLHDRDDGYIALPVQVTHDSQGRETLAVSEVIVRWDGSNLGLPLPGRKAEEDEPVDPGSALPTTIAWGFKAGAPGPILRVGGSYRLLLVARKLNGGRAPERHAARLVRDHALGHGDEPGNGLPDSPKVYGPVERAPVPTVLVPAGETLVVKDNNDDQASALALLVTPERPALRMLVSPKTGFDLAEQQGQFDPRGPGDRERAARAAKFGTYRMLARKADGSFPAWRHAGATAPAAEHPDALLFAVEDPGSSPPADPYFVDSTLCSVGMRLRATGATPEWEIAEDSATEEISFWNRTASQRGEPGQGFSQDGMRPVALQVIAVPRGPTRVIKGADIRVPATGLSVEAPVLRVEIAPGRTAELEVWLNKPAEAIAVHTIMDRLRQINPALFGDSLTVTRARTKTAQTRRRREEDWFAQTRNRRIPAFSDVLRFRIEHVVDRPQTAPVIQTIQARRVSDETWANEGERVNADESGAEKTFVFGSVTIDRLTTANVRAECAWMDVNPESVIARTGKAENPWAIEQDGLWSFTPTLLRDVLFDLDIPEEPPVRAENESASAYTLRVNTIDLARDVTGGLRNLTAKFRSNKARRLLVRLVATSRFAPSGASATSDLYTTESARRDRLDAAVISGGALPSGVTEVWLNATQAPEIPALTRDNGVVYRRRFSPTAGGSGTTLTHIYRCWMDRNWFSSGPGELLGIVCRDPSQADPPEWLRALWSRWGGDMALQPSIELSAPDAPAKEEFWLHPSQIVNADASGTVAMPPPPGMPPPPVDESRGVLLATLAPTFHEGAGRWYVDIELAPTAAFRASLQLCLVRYQPHAAPGCALSQPVRADAFVLPQPWTFSAVRRDRRTVEIRAMGPAYTGSGPMTLGLHGAPDPAETVRKAATPLVTVELERLDADMAPMPVTGPDGRPVATDNLAGGVVLERGYGSRAGSGIPAGWTQWTMLLNIPETETETRHAVRISVLTAHANAAAETEASADGALIYLPEPIVTQIILP